MDRIIKELKKTLSHERFMHTLGVMYTAECLAMRYDVDMEKARMAGLLHDCAKCLPKQEMQRLVVDRGLSMTEAEENNTGLLHSKAGRVLAEKRYGITDTEILDAITWHTTGRPAMTTLEKIIYIADFIEPGRNKARNLPEARRLAFRDLDACMENILVNTLSYLKKAGRAVDPMTQKTYNDIRGKK